MALSGTLLGVLNTMAGLISLPITGVGIWLALTHSSDCARALQWPAIALGAFILLLSLAGLLGSCSYTKSKSKCLLFLYLLLLLFTILALLAFTIFTFVLTNKGAGQALSHKGFLGDYSTWLQRNILDNPSHWLNIKSCLIHSKVCNKSLQDGSHIVSLSSFYHQILPSIESRCCKPPLACNFTYVNATFWKDATNITVASDCTQWNNNADILCFNCQSCKAGVLQDVKGSWRKLAITNGAILVFLILVFTLGCCAIANSNRRTPKPIDLDYVKA